MKTLSLLFVSAAVVAVVLAGGANLQAAPKPDLVVKLWEKPPGDFKTPGEEDLSPGRPGDKVPIARLTNVAEPRLEFYLPEPDKKNGTGVIILPGGGFGVLASDLEGSELALWLRARGIAAAVLEYRCPTGKLPKPWEFPAQDAQRAVSLLRTKASEFGVKPDRIGLFGFSSGGQAALIAATNATASGEGRLYPAADETDKLSCRPDFLALCYPWKILADGSTTELRPEVKISALTPPTFLAQATDDPSSLVAGTTRLYFALCEAKVPAELHLYGTGGHGFGLRANDTQAPGDWPGRFELWLQARGVLPKAEALENVQR